MRTRGAFAALVLMLSAAVPAQAEEEQGVWAEEQGVSVLDRVPLVTALVGGGVHCQVTSFDRVGEDEVGDVACYRGTEPVPVDGDDFTSTFSPTPPDGVRDGAYGYVFNDNSSTTPPGYNSTGGLVEVIYEGADPHVWVVRFAGEAFRNAGGNVQLTAVGADPARCEAVGWGPYDFEGEGKEGVQLRVRCDNLANPAVRPQWSLVYVHKRSIIGETAPFWGYVQADQLGTKDEYTPNSDRNVGTDGLMHSVDPQDDEVGLYQVKVFGPLARQTKVHVTANGDKGTFCAVTDVEILSEQPAGPEEPAALVDVTCYDKEGELAESKFTLNYYSPDS